MILLYLALLIPTALVSWFIYLIVDHNKIKIKFNESFIQLRLNTKRSDTNTQLTNMLNKNKHNSTIIINKIFDVHALSYVDIANLAFKVSFEINHDSKDKIFIYDRFRIEILNNEQFNCTDVVTIKNIPLKKINELDRELNKTKILD